MIRLLIGLAAALLMLSPASASEPAASGNTGADVDGPGDAVADPLTSLQNYIDSVASLQADFEQIMFDADSNITQVSTGNFRLLRPGRFRWDYQEPYEQTIVADGKRLWIYDADLEQVTVRRMDDSFAATPATLLSGVGAISDTYNFYNRFSADDLDWTELQSKLRDTDFGLVRLGFREDELRVMDLVDSLGQTTRISFSSIDTNTTLLPSVFTFVPPPGADVIGENDL